MAKSKQPKTLEHEDGVDMISNLPDPILEVILSRLQGTEEAVRTSILSTRWRYLWTSVPSIDLDCTRGQKRRIPIDEVNKSKFKEFVYWVLLNKPMHLDSFRLFCSDFYNISTIKQWIHAAAMRKVKVVDLIFCPKESDDNYDIHVPYSLVTCDSLEVLKICFLEEYLCLPNIKGFQALRVLELREVYLFYDNSVGTFGNVIKNCPLLEDLSVICCIAAEFQNLRVSSPKLKNLRMEHLSIEEGIEFHYTSPLSESIVICCPQLVFLNLTSGSLTYEYLLESLHSLKEAVIHLEYLFRVDEGRTFDFFDKLSHVESLSINLYCIGQCFDGEVDTHVSLLPNLKTLELTLHAFPNIRALIQFLILLPHLESLHLVFPEYENVYELDYWKPDDAKRMKVLTRHLKKVEFLDFKGEKTRMVLARSLLEHGNALEEMVFQLYCSEASFYETMKELSKFHKASSTVKLTAVFNYPIQANSTPAPKVLEINSTHVESGLCSSNSCVKIPGS